MVKSRKQRDHSISASDDEDNETERNNTLDALIKEESLSSENSASLTSEDALTDDENSDSDNRTKNKTKSPCEQLNKSINNKHVYPDNSVRNNESDSDDDTGDKRNKFDSSTSDGELEESEEEIEKFMPSSLPHNFVSDELYEVCAKKSNLRSSNIDEDDELFLVQCPVDIDINLLNAKNITLNGDSVLKYKTLDGINKKLKVTVEPETPNPSNITCVLNGKKSCEIVSNAVKGKITLSESIDSNLTCDETTYAHLIKEKLKTPLPEGLKLRHPLFGVEIPPKLRRKKSKKDRHSVVETEESGIDDTYKVKRKRKHPSFENYPNIKKEFTSDIDDSPTKLMKKIKRERSSDSDNFSRNETLEDCDSPKKIKKKRYTTGKNY